jgi:hypothetical protein
MQRASHHLPRPKPGQSRYSMAKSCQREILELARHQTCLSSSANVLEDCGTTEHLAGETTAPIRTTGDFTVSAGQSVAPSACKYWLRRASCSGVPPNRAAHKPGSENTSSKLTSQTGHSWRSATSSPLTLRRYRKDQRLILDFVDWELICVDRVLYLLQRHYACGFDGSPSGRWVRPQHDNCDRKQSNSNECTNRHTHPESLRFANRTSSEGLQQF